MARGETMTDKPKPRGPRDAPVPGGICERCTAYAALPEGTLAMSIVGRPVGDTEPGGECRFQAPPWPILPANEWCLRWKDREVAWPTKEQLNEVFDLLHKHPLRMKRWRWAGVFGGRVYHCEDDRIIATEPSVDDLDDPATQAQLWGEMRASLGIDTDAPLPATHILHDGGPLCGFSREIPAHWPEGHKWVPFDDPEEGATCDQCLKQLRSIRSVSHAILGED